MLTALIVLGSVFVSVQVGRFIGRKKLKNWSNEEKSASSALLFPVAHIKGMVGDNRFPTVLMEDFSAETYEIISSIVWPYHLMWTPVVWTSFVCYKIVNPALRLFFVPEKALKGIGNGAKAMTSGFRKRLEERKQQRRAALLELVVEDALPPMREELNGLLAEQEVVGDKIREVQEKICAEEARRMGTYREAPKLAASDQ